MGVLERRHCVPQDFIDKYLVATPGDRLVLIKSIDSLICKAEDIVLIAEVFRNIDDCGVFDAILKKSLESKYTSHISFEEWAEIHDRYIWTIKESRERLRLRYRTS